MQDYLSQIERYFEDPTSSEMSYRTPFQIFLESIFKKEDGFHIQHDAKSVGGNKPDFIVIKNGVAILYIEVKKVGENLDKIEKSDQATRYFGYTNLIISDYVNFRFYRNGERQGAEISLGKVNNVFKKMEPDRSNLDLLCKQIFDFPGSSKEPIKSGQVLAKIMGGRAQRIKFNVLEMLKSDSEKFKDLHKIKKVIHESLIKELDDEKFADMYAQTLVYGLFVARYNDKTPESFSRGEALTLLNKSNPFLYDFFAHIAGSNFPDKLRYIVDELCEIFSHASVKELMHDYFKSITLFGDVKHSPDPVIHFYEDFLKEYDPSKKMEMGVFYTPKPVVEFIIKSVDEILRKEFEIVKGLADTTRTAKKDKNGNSYHKVQILDVATGTGTFLNTLVEFVHKKYFVEKGQSAGWSDYVKKELLPRLNGFELMVASYTIAHLKLSMTLEETGVNNLDERLRIFLTNTLDEPKKFEWDNGMLFVGLQESITNESIEASKIKSEYPIMCIVGNPPYSGVSQNKNYKDNEVYKVEIGGKEKLKERKHWLDDDYVKFIRFGESLIDKNKEGIVAMITGHGFVENPTFRGMRWHLRKTFDKIYILDLHGNSRKKETKEDGGKDENVFDIVTGVSIFFGIKNKSVSDNKKNAKVYKYDLFGKREFKFEFLHENSLSSISWQELPDASDIWKLEGKGRSDYDNGFFLGDLFGIKSMGITTAKDDYAISYDIKTIKKRVFDFMDTTISDGEIRHKYNLKDNQLWKLPEARRKIGIFDEEKIKEIQYRIFDKRYVYFDDQIVFNRRIDVMGHMLQSNIALNLSKRDRSDNFNFFITDKITDKGLLSSLDNIYTFPLYVYLNGEKLSNLNKQIYKEINKLVGETTPENVLDYVYAILYSLTYREHYKEFLKMDFPRVPYPRNKKEFFDLVQMGEKLRNLHLMKDPVLENFDTTFNIPGNNCVEKVKHVGDKVYINQEQYFEGVPEKIWSFCVGGYKPLYKWLDDRKGESLSFNDIQHYQKIIKVLVETDRLMGEIDKIYFI